MTTFTYDAFRIGYDSLGILDAFDVVEITVVMSGDPTGIVYTLDQDGSAILTILGPQGVGATQIPFSIPLSYDVTFEDGTDPETLFFTVAEQNWATLSGLSGILQGMYYNDPLTGTEYYVPLGGDVLPVSSLQDVLSLGFSPVGTPRPIVGPLGPGQDVLPALTFNDPNFANLTRIEDDVIVLPESFASVAYGGAGNDVISGLETQVDMISYTELTGPVELKLNKGWAIKDGVGTDILFSFEDALGTSFDDTIIGTDASIDFYSNILFGGDGADLIRGRGGKDSIEGNNGDDRIFGDSGDDELYGGADEDRIDGGRGADVIYGGTENDVLLGRQDSDFIFGDNGDDTIYGGTGDDFLYGNDGADVIDGGYGDDRIFGGAQNDILRGRLDNDTIYGEGGEDRLVGGSGEDTLFGGDAKDDLYGNAGNDILFGGAGIDDLFGGKNADILDGGEDNDFLRGENGVDTFVFRDIEDMGRDRIMDWEDGRDLMDFSDYGFASFTQLYDLSSDGSGGLRIQLADDSDGDERVVIVENFLKADFDASDVLLGGLA